MFIETCVHDTLEDWVRLRHTLWPHAEAQDLRRKAAALLDQTENAVAFLARNDQSRVVGFAEAALRRDYVNGCLTSPVGFLEGIYVDPEWRQQGIARLLCQAVEDWAANLGCTELASDADLRNAVSHRMHEVLGFEETERVVYFRKALSAE